MPGLLGKKIGMTSVFSADGKNLPCTVIEVGPCVVTQIKTTEVDGYEAVQVGFEEKKEKHTTKPMSGHFKKAGVAPQRHLAEFKGFEGEYKLGDTITVDSIFNESDFVDIQGTSKGKGFTDSAVWASRPTASTTVCALPVQSVPAPTPQRCSRACAWPARWATKR